ncbi:hypothetical protein G7Y79_00042g078860 [Physcia stellaris]|nr:hypothetical protein G7Y79_00042g078860 [Physcia stellaris]
MTDTKRELKLSSSKDWDAWLSVVRAKATGYSIWDLIDPSKDTRPTGKFEPVEPNLDAQQGVDFTEKHARYKIALSKYKKELQDWKEQKDSMAKIIDHIYSTTTVTNLIFIQSVEIHPWTVLRALKARLAPTDSARSLELEQEYNRLIKGPSNRQSIDVWIDDYLKMLALAKQAKIAEVTDSKRAYRDFLQAIDKTASTFAEVYLLQQDNVTNHETQLLTLIETFRHHMRLKEARRGKGTISNSAFAADESKDTNGRNSSGTSSFRGQNQSRDPCICGKKHFYGDCFYLNENIRPDDFKLKPEIVAKIDEAKKNPKKRRQIEQSIKRADEKRQKKDDNNKSTEAEVGSFAAIHVNAIGSFTSDSSSSSYSLRSSWLMDHGFGIHVANSTMKQRFQKERDCTDGSKVMSGMGPLPILAYGRMRIDVDTPTGKKPMELLNVSYVPDFMVNIVAGSILADKGLHFDTAHGHLHRNGAPIVRVPRVGAHYVLEDNRSEGVGTFAATVRQGSTLEWHQLLAHANNDAIQHLQEAAEGVELTNKDKVPLTNKCEECALSKAHRIVSKSPVKSETSDKPFYRITYDLIDMTTALNKHKWISHVACSETGFHMIYTHESKGQATEVLIRAIHTIETRYNGKVVFVRSDGERALGTQWGNYCALKGITSEPSAVDTPAQNGHSERLGGILLTKSRAMRLEANLPVYLWPWVNETAGYIMNRTPSKKHGWKTPFEMVTGKKPNLAHIVQYGAKAYPLDKDIPKKEKMRAKAHIGFLVGYDSTNIFLIWIPSQRKVIRTRDVTFNEDSRYRPNELDLAQLVNEPFLTNDTLDIPQSDFTRIVDIESDSDEDVWELASTGSITDRDAKKSHKQVTEDDSGPGYLPSPAPSSSRGEDTSNTPDPSYPSSPAATETATENPSSPAVAETVEELPPPAPPLKEKKPKHWAKTTIDEVNIQPEGFTRIRKPNPLRGFSHYTALEDASAGGMRSFYGAFMTSMTKEKRPHRDDLLAESRFYHQMLKHPEAAGFLRAIDVEIKALQSKQTWKEVPWHHAKNAGKTSIPTTWVFKYKFDNEGYLVKHKARFY